LDEIAKLTYPQVIMLNHAAGINHKRMELGVKKRREQGNSTLSDDVSEMTMPDGRKLTEMTSAEIIDAHEGARPRTIKVKKKE
jgi:hypothetical protein